MLYINVPYAEKNEAKKLGAKWNPKMRSWYVDNRGSYYKFHKWILTDAEEKTILCDYFFIVEGKRKCYNCHKEIEVIAFGVKKYCILYNPLEYRSKYSWGDNEIHLVSYIEPLNKKFLQYLNEKYNYRLGYSKTVGDSYLANHCKHCNALQGDYYLYSENDSPFFVDTQETAHKLRLIKVRLEDDIIADVGHIWNTEDYLIKRYAYRSNDIIKY